MVLGLLKLEDVYEDQKPRSSLQPVKQEAELSHRRRFHLRGDFYMASCFLTHFCYQSHGRPPERTQRCGYVLYHRFAAALTLLYQDQRLGRSHCV